MGAVSVNYRLSTEAFLALCHHLWHAVAVPLPSVIRGNSTSTTGTSAAPYDKYIGRIDTIRTPDNTSV